MAEIHNTEGRRTGLPNIGSVKEITDVSEVLTVLHRGETLPQGFKASPTLIASMNAAAEVKEITNVREVLALLKTGHPIPQGFKASPALIADITAATKGPTPEGANALFDAIRATFPRKTLGDGRWYLVAVSLHNIF